MLNNWTCPSFCSSLNNAIAGFIGDHYSNCLIIASTLALAAAHSLSAYRPSHRLCDAQQCVTLDREVGWSLSLSLWPAWHHYSILAHGERGEKNSSLFLSLSTSCFIFSYMPHFPCVCAHCYCSVLPHLLCFYLMLLDHKCFQIGF